MKHSILFPHHTSWLNALKLAIPSYLGGVVVFTFGFWQYTAASVALAITQNAGSTAILCIAFLCLLGGAVWYLLLTLLFSLLLRLLWSKPPKWLKPSTNWRRILQNFSIATLSALPVLLAFIGHVLATEAVDFTKTATYQLNIEKVLLNFSWVWFITAAYLYQIEFVIKSQRKVKKR
ncbi:MAG: hypothetical protein HC840_24085 [Leptolyngbyaceae cyanobacterium RM2_2_4]|nr:hypothetical protein [Leptolyngbyaceae cyanobacterium SM1_4_3]NJO51980.1 hypothetical protein [Leptolyngbyaceae cyanobacterium RM2_2_4]NJO76153.1 hypothetical protein [Leptolyngbyaceae cyanobacterium RM1_406_9]